MTQYIPHLKYFIVRKQSIAGELMKRGFVLEKLEKCNDGSNRNVFLFSNTEKIVNAFNQIISSN
jgi:hypothetical protein